MDYKESGVDISAGEIAVQKIKSIVRSTYNKNVLAELGSFGGLYQLDLDYWKEPILVSSTDGVGTKLIVAQKAKKYDTIGQDLVNHCVNDIFVHGAVPQFFNDYIGIAKMQPEVIEQIIWGMSKACKENEMALIGGEMAEMPGIYHADDFDLVGTIVGLVEKKNLITGSTIAENDVIIGFPSSGLHTNGYSLARKIIFEKLALNIDSYIKELNTTIQEALLSIHLSYFNLLKNYAASRHVHGMAHITGGGLKGNIKRILPSDLSAEIDCAAWKTPPIFSWLVNEGEVPLGDAYSTFNMGIGFVLICSSTLVSAILEETEGLKIGLITKKENQESVILKNMGFFA